jgi:hypothetical protein
VFLGWPLGRVRPASHSQTPIFFFFFKKIKF